MTINDKLIKEGVDELLGMIDNSLETLRDYGEPWNKLFQMDTDDHMKLMDDFERQVLIGVGKKLLEKGE